MTFVRILFSIAVLTAVTMAISVRAATDDQRDSHPPSAAATVRLAQAAPGSPGMGMRAGAAMPGYADQMKDMQQIHDRMLAAKTPEERNALMAEQMNLMHNGMNMMGGMGGGAMMGRPGDMAARQGMLEQRMDMMQSMMQMMMDRMQSVPATK